jgi:hypothetical protein
VRDFEWNDEALEKQDKEIADLGTEEKELWVGDVARFLAVLISRPTC